MCRCKTQALEAGQITGTWAILPGISHPYLCAQPPHRRWAPGGAQHPEAWGEEWGDRVSAAQGAGARVLVRLLCWSQSLPAPGLVLIRALSCFMAYISVVCVVAGEGCLPFLRCNRESPVRLLAERRLGKAVTAAKRGFVPMPPGVRLGYDVPPGLFVCLMS